MILTYRTTRLMYKELDTSALQCISNSVHSQRNNHSIMQSQHKNYVHLLSQQQQQQLQQQRVCNWF
jgi:hypothetical protein